MDYVDILTTATAILSFTSFVVLQWSVPKVGRPLNIIFFLASVLALFYCGAYVWLIFNTGSAASWQIVMRWVSLVIWPLVWMGPALASVRTRTNRNRMITEAAQKLRSEEL